MDKILSVDFVDGYWFDDDGRVYVGMDDVLYFARKNGYVSVYNYVTETFIKASINE